MLNLYNILLENIDYERLIEEGKDPVEVLHYKFQSVPSDIIDSIIAIDPTKKKSYSQWVLNKWKNENEIISSALQNGRLEKLFQFFKEHQEKQIKDCPSVSEGLDAYVPQNEDTVLDKSSELETYLINLEEYVDSELANDFDIVFNEDNWLIAVPNTYEASCKLGENCWWCTANHYGNGRGYYNEYLREGGKYYINFDLSQGETLDDKTVKEYPYTRYQFHFESHQFKAATEGEPDVDINEINMPQSAYDFYESHEGKDMSDLEDLETKMYRYEDDRWQDAIRLNDDLYLNISYDDNYEYHEPTDYDDWYVFDNEDDRDPISYTEVNPTNGIKYQSDDIIIIETANDEDKFLAVIRGAAESRYRDWGGINITKYAFAEGYDNVLFALSTKNSYKSQNYIMFARGGYEPMFEELVTETASNIFVNPSFKNYENTYGFVEIVLEDGYHSLLYGTDEDLEYVIHKDIPSNGEYFILNEDNTIQGEFRTYNLDSIFTEGDSIDYRLDTKLDNGDYLVKQYKWTENIYGNSVRKPFFNVLNAQTRELVFDFWADEIHITPKGYIVTANGTKKFYNFEGEILVNGEYDKIVRLTDDCDIIVGVKPNNKGYDLIDENSGTIFAEFASIDLHHKPVNNKIIVAIYEPTIGGNLTHIYDYAKRQLVYENYEHLYTMPCGYMLATLPNNEGRQILDYKTDTIILDNIAEYQINKIYKRIVLTFKDGKKNVMNFMNGNIYAPVNFDEFVDEKNDIIIYKNEGKYFYYNSKEGNFLINPNGTKYIGTFHMYGTINFELEHYVVGYYIVRNEYRYCDRRYNADLVYGDFHRVASDAPQEVIDFYNKLTGDNLQAVSSQTEAIPAMAEQFQRIMNRLNEARKLNFQDLY